MPSFLTAACNPQRPAALVGVLLIVAVYGQNPVQAEALPRYQLRPGLEIVYRSADTPAEADIGSGDKTVVRHDYQWTLRVAKANDDGSHRIVFRQKWTSRVFSPRGGLKTYDEPSVMYGDGYFDVAPDGRIVENWTIHAFCDPTALFPPLPSDRHGLVAGWTSSLAFDGTRRLMQSSAGLPEGDAARWAFSETEEKPEHAVSQTKRRREYLFDLHQGLVQQLTTRTDEGWTSLVRPAIPIELVGRRQCEPRELETFCRDSDAYYKARQASDRLLDRAGHDLGHTRELLSEARSTLAAVESQVSEPFVQAMLADKLADYDEEAARYLRRAQSFADLLNVPSAPWEAVDLDGKTHCLKDYRGKVVVLDFWNRSCAWCVRSMPNMKKLADDFRDAEVAVLGVNLDAQDTDARFVVETVKINFPTLRNPDANEQMAKAYRVTAIPTVVVLDRAGVVRHVGLGYSPALREDLGNLIRELLSSR